MTAGGSDRGGDREKTPSGGGFHARPPGGGTAKLPLFRKCPLRRLLRLRSGGERARLRCCYSNQETAAVPNGLESSTFPGVRESLAHACWGLWHPFASRAVRNLASDRPLRRRRSPTRSPPFPLCAGAQSRAGNLRSGRAHPSPRCLLLSRATFLGPLRNRPFFSSALLTRRGRGREPGPRPFSVSLLLTNLVSVLPPFSVPEAGRSRSADGKNRSCLP